MNAVGVGVRWDDRVTGKLTDFAPAAKAAGAAGTGGIIHFDILPKNVGKVISPHCAVVGDCAKSLEALLPLLDAPADSRTEWLTQLDGAPLFPFCLAFRSGLGVLYTFHIFGRCQPWTQGGKRRIHSHSRRQRTVCVQHKLFSSALLSLFCVAVVYCLLSV